VIFARDGTKTQILDARRIPIYTTIEGTDGPHAVRLQEAYVSHFVTCKDRDLFSASKKKGGDDVAEG
jgi:hypothetical protein